MPSMTNPSEKTSIPMGRGDDREIVYIADPMCSWCWGFAPVIRAIADRYRRQAPVRVVPGGLRVGDRLVFDADFKARLRDHWRRVEAETGQAFEHAFFERTTFNYNTEPACRAVVCVNRLDESRALDYFEAVQAAFYRENRDVTDPGVLAAVATETGLDDHRFEDLWRDPEIREATFEAFKWSRRSGARGFPTVFLRRGDHFDLLTSGYQPYRHLAGQIDDWLDGRPSSLNLF